MSLVRKWIKKKKAEDENVLLRGESDTASGGPSGELPTMVDEVDMTVLRTSVSTSGSQFPEQENP